VPWEIKSRRSPWKVALIITLALIVLGVEFWQLGIYTLELNDFLDWLRQAAKP
jgi:hypothetical protein